MTNSETSKERIRSTRDREQPGDTPDTATSRAIASFQRLRLSTQRMLAREVAATRGDDLRKAYPDIIDVTVGNRSRRDPSTGRSRVVRETCVILVIERKKTHVAEQHRLPEVLMTYHTVRGKRLLVAVPVDVEERSALAGATPDAAPTRLAVFCGDVSPTFGQACCAVRDPLVPDAIMVVSCKHVFTLEAMLHGEFKSSLLYLADDPEEVAEIALTLDRAGALREGTPDANFSFDAQLADVFGNDDAKARLHAVLGDVTLGGVVKGFDTVPHDLWVQTSRGPIKVEFDEQAPRVAKIVYSSIGDVYHETLLISQFQHSSDLQKGDSGSAVTTEKNGGKLVGMHIGSDQEQLRAYAIPGWQLLDPRKYR